MCYYYVANTYDYVGWSLERHNDVGHVLDNIIMSCERYGARRRGIAPTY